MRRWAELEARIRELGALGTAQGIVSWDQQVMMPPRGVGARSKVRATLAAISHEKTVDPALGELLDEARAAELDDDRAVIVERFAWSRDRAVKIPSRLASELAETTSSAVAVWQDARAKDDFSLFAPALEKVLQLKAESAECLGYETEPYEAHFEPYERGLTPTQVRETFDEISRGLKPILDRVLGANLPEAKLPDGPYDLAAQLAYAGDISARLGLDADASRIDLSAHPFCSGFAPTDVRITTRVRADDPAPAILAAMHETGHALYEAGLAEEWDGTALGNAASNAVHESQSRLWENHVGRSMPFWLGELVRAQDALTPLRSAGAVDVYRAVNRVRPSLIRVEADELTYPFHIILRFELELAMARGEIKVRDLPAAWNDAMQKHLGIRPPSDADGVLQDTHWAIGLFGYFPTYLLGSMYAAALFEKASADLGDMDERLRAGDFAPLLGWLREKVHSQGARRLGAETVAFATGEKPTPAPYLRYLDAKFAAITELATAAV